MLCHTSFIFLTTTIWLAIGVFSLTGLGSRGAGSVTLAVIGLLMVGNAGAMGLSGYGLS